MPSSRNMSRRKPVPKYIPDPPPSIARFSTLKPRSLAQVDKEVPPLPDDWFEKMEGVIGKEKRHGFVFDSVADSRWINECKSRPVPSQREGLQERHDLTDRVSRALPPVRSAEDIEESAARVPQTMRRKHSLPQHYRPPTPPLPKDRAQRRILAGHEEHVISEFGLSHEADATSREIFRSKYPSSATIFSPDHSVTAINSMEDMHAPSYVSHAPQSQGSKGFGSRIRCISCTSSAARSRLRCEPLHGIWGEMKSLGIHVRLKMAHMFRPDTVPA